MHYGSLSVGLAFAACLGGSGCGEKKLVSEEPLPVQRSECAGIFVLAPASYMQYIQHDEATLLASEGRMEDLPVYCTEEMARMFEATLEHDQQLAPGLWRVYRLDGVWEEDVVEVEPGQWRMRRPARLIALSSPRDI